MATQNIILEGLIPGGRCLNFVVTESMLVYHLKYQIYSERFISPGEYYLTSNGVRLENNDDISCSQNCFRVLRAHPLLLGGKGGFGTLIRAMGTQINKGSRKGACRDLSGRRMRDVDAEKKLAKWMALEPERKKKCMEQRRKKLERRRNQPKHHFNDSSYMDQIRSAEENIDTALQQGLQAKATSTGTRKLSEYSTRKVMKKQQIWVGVDDNSDDNSDEHSNSDIIGEQSCEESEGNEPEEFGMRQDGIDFEGKNSSSTSDIDTTESTACEHSGPSVSVGDSDITTVGTDEKQGDCTTSILQGSVSTSQSQVVDMKESGERVNNETTSGGAEVKLKVIDVEKLSTVEELVLLGGDALKYTLQSMGLKCGGTVTERAQRLLSTKGKSMDEIDRSLFAKNKKWKTMK